MFLFVFPKYIQEDAIKVINMIPPTTFNNVSVGVSNDVIEYSLNGHLIKFPYRIYFNEIPEQNLNTLDNNQKIIAHCIYSRSCNGFVREKHIRELLKLSYYDDWVIPFIVKICDEYIVEILEIIYETLSGQDNIRFKKFCIENHNMLYKGYSRMISYWNEFYRDKYPYFKRCIGRKLFKQCFGYSHRLKQRR